MNYPDAVFERLAEERAAMAKDPPTKRVNALLARLFPEQRAFVDDPAKRKAILCPSRAGKTFALAAYLLKVLLTVPRANVLYVAFVRGEAKEIMWNQLKALNEDFRLGLAFGEAELTVTNRKGSVARLAGCESWGDVDKFRGVPRNLVILDEAATWTAALLNDLIYKVIEPRLGDHKGTLVMAGTPGEILAGPFYDTTGPHAYEPKLDEEGARRAMSRPYAERDEAKWRDVKFAWSTHGWPKSANVSVEGKNAWSEALKLKARNAWGDDNPIWIREHLGRWIADDSKLVARYDSARDDWIPGERTPANPFGLPEGHAWRFVVSCDMGFHDPFAVQVGAYSDTHPWLFQVYEFEQAGLTIHGVADALRHVHALIDADDIEAQVADIQGLGGMVVESLASDYGIFIDALEQRQKRDHVELMNAGYVDGKIKVLRGSRLATEMLYLAWDPSGLKPRSNQPNHNFDAWLGVVRHSRHLEAEPKRLLPPPGSPAAMNQAANDDEAHVAAKERRRARGDGGGLREDTEWSE